MRRIARYSRFFRFAKEVNGMRNISFDIAAIAILVLILLSVIVRRSISGRINKIFLGAIITNFLAAVFDIMSVYADTYHNDNIVLLALSHTFYLIFHTVQPVLYALFTVNVLDLGHKINNNKSLEFAFSAPYVLVFLLIATNSFTGLIFTLNGGIYRYGILFNLLYISTALYILIAGVVILKNCKVFPKIKIIGLLSMAGLSIAAAALQMVMPQNLVECFAISLSLLVVNISVQRPEESLDTDTGLYRHSAYADKSKRSFRNGKHWHVILMNIANYNSIYSMLGYEETAEINKIIADKLVHLNKTLSNRAELYYLDRGRYRMVFAEKDRVFAETYATIINNILKEKIIHKGFEINLSPVIVLGRCPEEIESFKSLMAFGMDFHEKLHHTGMVMLASEVYNPNEFQVHNNIDAIIENALENKKFQVYYQPIYSVAKGRFVTAEALVRLIDDEHGFVSPDTFISAAERSGAIHKIGEFVFEEVCKFVSSEEFEKLGLDYVEVNLSVAQCMHGDLADKILTTMKTYNVPPNRINLEITETAASYNQRVMTDNLNRLSRAGIVFSLDDYGTGYSNMKRVISLPLKIVKLDKSFVDEQHNPKMWILLKSTVKMLKDMGMEIVVEGIETREMVEAFSDLKCDFIQGYYFSKAIPKDAFVKFITESQVSIT